MHIKSTLRWLLPVMVTGALLGYLVDAVNLQTVLAAMNSRALAVLSFVAVFYGVLSLFLEGVSLASLSRYSGYPAATATCARIKAASYALGVVNYALGAAALIYLFYRRLGAPVAVAAGLVATISVIDITVLLIIVTCAALFSPVDGSVFDPRFAVFIIALAVLAFVTLRASFELGPLDRARRLSIFRVIRAAPLSLLLSVVLVRGVFVLTFLGLGAGSLYAFNIAVPVSEIFVGMAVVTVVAAVPIAVSGLGTVQFAMLAMFSRYADEATVLSCSLAMHIAILLVRGGIALVYAREFTADALRAAGEESPAVD